MARSAGWGWFVVVSVVAGSAGAPARAGVGYADSPPAATLLLPYFEVDLDRPLGRTTLSSLNNASATAVLTNVTFWTDLGVPTLRFNVYLTGYDFQTVNLRDIFNGVPPRTVTVGQGSPLRAEREPLAGRVQAAAACAAGMGWI